MKINSDFATEILLEYRCNDFNISAKVTDENDILALKQILKGHSLKDSPSCGFSSDISITVTNGRKSLVFYPATDGCRILRIGNSNKYLTISNEDKVILNAIVGKYGMVFPCF